MNKGKNFIYFWIFLFVIFFSSFGRSQVCVDFESLVTNTQYGSLTGNSPGDTIFTENGIIVSLHRFFITPKDSIFNGCSVWDQTLTVFGKGKYMAVFGANLKFDFSNLEFTPNRVTFDFAEYSAGKNMSINGEPVFIGQWTDYKPPSGIKYTIKKVKNVGYVIFRGPITSLLLGGAEDLIDNICSEDTSSVGVQDIGFADSPNIYDYELKQNFPNPFNPNTVIKFTVKEQGRVLLQVYNILGEVVAQLTDRHYSAGTHEVKFNASGLPPGVYFYKIETRDFRATKKMMLIP